MAEVVIFAIAAVGGPTIVTGTAAAIAIHVGVAVATTALAASLSAQAANDNRSGGVRTETTTAGDQMPQSFILGTYMTAGNLVAPEMSHGVDGDRRYLTRVVDVSDMQVTGLDSLIVDGKKMTLADGTPATLTTTVDGWGPIAAIHPQFGASVDNRANHVGFLYCQFYSGSQTAADPGLISNYGAYPERPWSSDMIGRGVAYAVLTFYWRNSPQIYSGSPDVKLVVNGIRLYDPRLDSTAGGSGSHRYGTTSTHAFSDNPVVMVYNILRGIQLLDGNVYGGGFTASDLPYATWAAAMNACDVLISGRKTYIAGYEVRIGTPDVGGDAPLDVIDQLLNACSGEIADVGGTMFIRVGPPALPVKFITDDDILRTSPQDLDPFPAVESSHNGVHATYPSPSELWQAKEAPPRYDAAAEAADGQRLIADLQLPAVPNGQQVQQLMKAWLADEMRRRVHNITLPPEGILLNPLDTIDWTSARNGYMGKDFEIAQIGIDPRTLSTTLSIRERDPSDYDWVVGDEISVTVPSVEVVVPGPLSVPGWAVTGVSITDAGGANRRPALRLAWTALPTVTGITWQVRVTATAAAVASGSTDDVDQGFLIVSEGILPSTAYQARARLVSNEATVWTAWTAVTSPATYISATDFSGGTIPAVDLSGVLDIARFATTIRPIEVVASLPTTGNFEGRTVYLTTTDGAFTADKQYRWTHPSITTGTTYWTAAVPAVDVTGQLTNAQIADIAAAKLTGQITSTQITDDAITTPKIAAGAVSANEIAAGSIVTDKIAADAITTAKIAAGAITATEIATNAITAGKIAADAVTAGTIAAGVVSATEIAAGAIIASKLAVADFTNLVPDSELQDSDAWTNPAQYTVIPATSATGAYSKGEMRCTFIDAGSKQSTSKQFSVVPNQKYWAQFQKARTGGTVYRAYAQLYWYDKDGVYLSASSIGSTTEIVGNTSPAIRTAEVTAPSNAVLAAFRWWVIGADTDAQVRLWAPTLRVMNGGELIVDGAISADKIAANAITAGKISAGAIDTTDLIVDGAVSRRFYAYEIAVGLNITGTDRVLVSKTGMSGKFNAFVGTVGDRDNPILFNAAGRITCNPVTTDFTRVYFYSEYQNASSVWVRIATDVVDVVPGQRNVPFAFSRVLDDVNFSTARGFRLVANRETGTGGTIPDWSADFMLTQISV